MKNDKELIKGGLADGKTVEDIAKKHNVSVEQIQKQIEKGYKIEYEHVNDKKRAIEIAKDHLMEIPDYYDRLEKMEKEAKKELEEKNNDKQDNKLELKQKIYDKIEKFNESNDSDDDDSKEEKRRMKIMTVTDLIKEKKYGKKQDKGYDKETKKQMADKVKNIVRDARPFKNDLTQIANGRKKNKNNDDYKEFKDQILTNEKIDRIFKNMEEIKKNRAKKEEK